MRVLIISANTERLNMPTMPLGAGLVTEASRRAGHDVTLLDLMLEPDPLAAVQRSIAEVDPAVIGVSIRNIDDQDMEQPTFLLEKARPVLDACRENSSATLVLGGAGYSIFPAAALDYLGAEMGIRGEGEEAFPALLERLEAGADLSGIPGVHLPGQGIRPPTFVSDMSSLAGPADDLWQTMDPTGADIWIPLQSRRGCPNDCAYCSTAAIQGRPLRTRPATQLAAQVERFKARGFKQFYIVDNTFNMPTAHALEVCSALGRLQITWRCIIYPHGVTETLVRAMAEAGCVEVALGFESGSPGVLRALNKHFSPEEVRQVCSMLADHGIRRMGFLLLGGPGETRASVEQSLGFADSLALDSMRTTVGLRVYPETSLARTALQEGVVEPGDDLLQPRFYLAPGLEPWIRERVTPGISAFVA